MASLMLSRRAAAPRTQACSSRHPSAGFPVLLSSQRHLQKSLVVYAEPETATPGEELENPDSEQARKKAQAEKLRAAEKFMVIGSGNATCQGCGYEYRPEKGDPDFPIAKGITFQDLPADYICPVCGAPKEKFNSKVTEIAGFAENQKYGFGTNSMTSGQKLGLIYGGLLAAFMLFLSGYAMQ